jgi:hypothetical protein
MLTMADAGNRPVVGPETPVPDPADTPEGRTGRISRKTARIRILGDHLKVAEVESRTGQVFRFYSDEPPAIGGRDEYPQPLHYLVAAVGF